MRSIESIVPPPAKVTSRKHARRLTTQYHNITRRLASAKTLTERLAFKEELMTMGGVQAYQAASSLTTSLFSTSRWVTRVLRDAPGVCIASPCVLEIGAINTQLLDAPGFAVRAIDLCASGPRIQQQDFLSLPHGGEVDDATGATFAYDAVACSMVLNCVPDPRKRFNMLVGIRAQLRSGGRAFLTVPRSCLDHSFTLTEHSFIDCLAAVGLSPNAPSPDGTAFTSRACAPRSTKIAFFECVASLPDTAAAARFQRARHSIRSGHRKRDRNAAVRGCATLTGQRKSAGSAFDIDLGGYLGLGVRVARSFEPPGARRVQANACDEFLHQCTQEHRYVATPPPPAAGLTARLGSKGQGGQDGEDGDCAAFLGTCEIGKLNEPQRAYANWRWHGGQGWVEPLDRPEWRLASSPSGVLGGRADETPEVSSQVRSGWQWTEQNWEQRVPVLAYPHEAAVAAAPDVAAAAEKVVVASGATESASSTRAVRQHGPSKKLGSPQPWAVNACWPSGRLRDHRAHQGCHQGCQNSWWRRLVAARRRQWR